MLGSGERAGPNGCKPRLFHASERGSERDEKTVAGSSRRCKNVATEREREFVDVRSKLVPRVVCLLSLQADDFHNIASARDAGILTS